MQDEFYFSYDHSPPSASDPLAAWRETRLLEQVALARRVGLPLGALVEVWLKNGIRLRGTLRLREEWLNSEEVRLAEIRLEVESVAFLYKEMESCVRAA